MNKMQDKRQFIRLSAYHLAKYKPLSFQKEEAIPVITTIRDISAGGICLRTEEYLPVSSMLELKINFPAQTTPIFTLVKVVWIKKRANGRYYEVGAQFAEIEESARRFINDHIAMVNKTIASQKEEDRFFILKGGGRMLKLSKAMVVLAAIALLAALSIKFTTMGRILPGPFFINWAKLADTFLLFSIAFSLLAKR